MPELPEVETVCRGLESAIKGHTIASVALRRKDLRTPFPRGFAAALEGQRITHINRRAKYILIHLANKTVLIIHLGMSGTLLIHRKEPAPKKHDHVLFALSGNLWLVFNDARRFGLMDIAPESALPTHRLFKGLGLEPLEKAFTGPALHAMLKGKKAPIKTAIMDQRLVVGVGNIYASESLFMTGVNPRRAAGKLTPNECEALSGSIKKVLKSAIASGGSTLRDYVRSTGDSGYFQHEFKVYGREDAPCLTCGNPVQRIVQQGRSTFFCPQCQKH